MLISTIFLTLYLTTEVNSEPALKTTGSYKIILAVNMLLYYIYVIHCVYHKARRPAACSLAGCRPSAYMACTLQDTDLKA